MSIFGRSKPKSVVAHILHPDKGYVQQTYVVGRHISEDTVAKFADNGHLYLIVHLEQGEPKTIACKRELWNEAKARYDQIDDEGKAFEKDIVSRSAPQQEQVTPSGIKWHLAADKLHDRPLFLVGPSSVVEVKEATLALALILARTNGWVGGTSLFTISGNNGVLNEFRDGTPLSATDALTFAPNYLNYLRRLPPGGDRGTFDHDLARLCSEGGFTIQTARPAPKASPPAAYYFSGPNDEIEMEGPAIAALIVLVYEAGWNPNPPIVEGEGTRLVVRLPQSDRVFEGTEGVAFRSALSRALASAPSRIDGTMWAQCWKYVGRIQSICASGEFSIAAKR